MLFKEMWEPHQTSAFLCAGLMWVYRAVTGTFTGVVLYLRFVTAGIQLALTYCVYRTLLGGMRKEYAFLLAVLYFNIVPKNIQIPEFGNMQLWFLTAGVLLMMKYYHDQEREEKNRWYLPVAAGIALSCEILTYPTCIILFPFFLVWIFVKSGKRRWRDSLILIMTCAVCGGVWLIYVFRNVSLQEFGENIGRLVSYDPTHEISGMTEIKTRTYADNLVLWAAWLAVTGAVSGLFWLIVRRMCRRKGREVSEKAGCLSFWSWLW